jgi:hypothetical protein
MADGEEFAELQRIIRVSDQSCTAYGLLRDRNRRKALVLDLSILVISTWLVAMAFVQPSIGELLAPRGLKPEIWIGLLAVLSFALSLVQLQVNWKGRAEAYQRSLVSLSAFVRECKTVSNGEAANIRAALARYRVITDSLEPIPEGQFLTLKKKHKLKVAISRHLDDHPGASLWLLKLRLWIRDNFSYADTGKPKAPK